MNQTTPEATDRTEAGFFRRNKTKLLVGAAGVSFAATLALNPVDEVIDEVKDAAPYVLPGVAASEALFIGGGVMMAGTMGRRVINPFRIRERLPEIVDVAENSRVFKAGFVVNTIGAVGTSVAVGAGVVAELPPESYGLLAPTFADLGVTISVRSAMISAKNAVRSNYEEDEPSED